MSTAAAQPVRSDRAFRHEALLYGGDDGFLEATVPFILEGIWLVNHLCDLVQIRSFPTGTVVRLHLAIR